jgi:hypothetical protein
MKTIYKILAMISQARSATYLARIGDHKAARELYTTK